MRKIEVHGGDIPNNTYFIDDGSINGVNLNDTLIELEILDSVNMSERTYSGTFASGLVGYALLGPLGSIGGMLVGGPKKNTNTVIFACGLSNGITFIGESERETFSYLKSIYSRNINDQKLEAEKQESLRKKSEEKECPQCAETVKLNAKVCRFCGYKFTKNELKASSISALKSKRELESKKAQSREASYDVTLDASGFQGKKEEISIFIGAHLKVIGASDVVNDSISNPPVTIKKNLDYKSAVFYKEILEKFGEVEIIERASQPGKIRISEEQKEFLRGVASRVDTTPSGSGGCFIATATYGDYDHPDVIRLRKFRDNYLAKKSLGRQFIKTYYSYSPYAANIIKHSHSLRLLSYMIIVKPLVIFTYFLKNTVTRDINND